MNQLKIYVAGAMESISATQQKGWRNECKEYFRSFPQVSIIDPTRRVHESDLTVKEIFTMDLNDVEQSNLVLVDSRNIGPVWGTPCECFYAAHVLKKPVISWYNSEYPITKSRRVFQNVLFAAEFDSLEKALQHIEEHYIV
jgi:hypothetical protein